MDTWGILWDLDGVIVDTGDYHYHTWKQLLAGRGIHLEFERFRPAFGMTNAEVLPLWLGRSVEPDEINQLSHDKESLFRAAIRGNVVPLPGVEHWLQQFQQWEFPQAVASSAPQANIELLVDELDIRRYFLTLVSATSMPSKPDPAVFVEAARQIQKPPGRCIVIEDAIVGVEAARRAGMKCIAVTTTHPPAALSAASLIISQLEDLSEEHLFALFKE